MVVLVLLSKITPITIGKIDKSCQIVGACCRISQAKKRVRNGLVPELKALALVTLIL